MDGGAWWATVHGVAKSQTRLSDFTSLFTFILVTDRGIGRTGLSSSVSPPGLSEQRAQVGGKSRREEAVAGGP